jgi:hypothetical protein
MSSQDKPAADYSREGSKENKGEFKLRSNKNTNRKQRECFN